MEERNKEEKKVKLMKNFSIFLLFLYILLYSYRIYLYSIIFLVLNGGEKNKNFNNLI